MSYNRPKIFISYVKGDLSFEKQIDKLTDCFPEEIIVDKTSSDNNIQLAIKQSIEANEFNCLFIFFVNEIFLKDLNRMSDICEILRVPSIKKHSIIIFENKSDLLSDTKLSNHKLFWQNKLAAFNEKVRNIDNLIASQQLLKNIDRTKRIISFILRFEKIVDEIKTINITSFSKIQTVKIANELLKQFKSIESKIELQTNQQQNPAKIPIREYKELLKLGRNSGLKQLSENYLNLKKQIDDDLQEMKSEREKKEKTKLLNEIEIAYKTLYPELIKRFYRRKKEAEKLQSQEKFSEALRIYKNLQNDNYENEFIIAQIEFCEFEINKKEEGEKSNQEALKANINNVENNNNSTHNESSVISKKFNKTKFEGVVKKKRLRLYISLSIIIVVIGITGIFVMRYYGSKNIEDSNQQQEINNEAGKNIEEKVKENTKEQKKIKTQKAKKNDIDKKNTIKSLIQKGDSLYSEKDFFAAKVKFEKALTLDSENKKIKQRIIRIDQEIEILYNDYIRVAKIYLKADNGCKYAKNKLNKALLLRPNDTIALKLLAKCNCK